jgi:hypothetical protein
MSYQPHTILRKSSTPIFPSLFNFIKRRKGKLSNLRSQLSLIEKVAEVKAEAENKVEKVEEVVEEILNPKRS